MRRCKGTYFFENRKRLRVFFYVKVLIPSIFLRTFAKRKSEMSNE